MQWNWQQPDWPHFKYDPKTLASLEARMGYHAGILMGSFKHLKDNEKNGFTVEFISYEALKTSEIEGEYLDRASVQSSIRRHFGLETDPRKISPAEHGIAQMMVDVYESFEQPLTHQKLFFWHTALTRGRSDLIAVGRYRTHKDSMQVVSGPIHKPKVHFEAPPSNQVQAKMAQFVKWFNSTSPKGQYPLETLTRAAIAHLYFISIHPFEDGNGRIARAISEKALAQCLGYPTLIFLSYTIEKHKKQYYIALEQANKSNEVTTWLVYFSGIVLEAQRHTQARIEFLIKKTHLYDRLRGQLNLRQEKVLSRMFQEGPEGFKGGLSAENYISITKTSRATATRDLGDLVAKGALVKTGILKHTRYSLSS